MTLLTISAQAGWQENTIAAVLVAEAGGEGLSGMQLVAEVIINRAQQGHKSIVTVISKPGEFTCLNHTTSTKLYLKWLRKNPQGMQEALKLVQQMLKQPEQFKRRLPRNVLFYDNKRYPKADSWPQNLAVFAIIGNHRFWVTQ